MKKTLISLLCYGLAFCAQSQTIKIPPPPGEQILPGNQTSPSLDVGPGVPKTNSKNLMDCSGFKITPSLTVDVNQDAQIIKYKANKPNCIKMIATDDEWLTINRTEDGFAIVLTENEGDTVRTGHISVAGLFSGEYPILLKQRSKNQPFSQKVRDNESWKKKL